MVELGECEPLPRVDCIVITRHDQNTLLNEFDSSEFETHIFLFGKYRANKSVVTDVLIPSEDDYIVRNLGCAEVDPEFVAQEFPKFEEEGKTLVAYAHSHPRGLDTPSSPDLEKTYNANLHYYPHVLTGIYDREQLRFFKASMYNAKECRAGGDLIIVKEKVIEYDSLKRFDRQIRAIGLEGQLLISSTEALLIGVGGGNTIVAFALASMGIGKLVLIDHDKWEETNRNRVFIPREHVGRYKVCSIKQLINDYYPEIKVEKFVNKAEYVPTEVYERADIIVVGPDSLTARIHGNREALKYSKPAIFPAAGIYVKDNEIHSFGGSIQVIVPNHQTPCYECVAEIDAQQIVEETLSQEKKEYLKEKYKLGDGFFDVPIAPSVISLNYTIAGTIIWEIVKLVTEIGKTIPFQVYDGLAGTLESVGISKNDECPACGNVDWFEEREFVIPAHLVEFTPKEFTRTAEQSVRSASEDLLRRIVCKIPMSDKLPIPDKLKRR